MNIREARQLIQDAYALLVDVDGMFPPVASDDPWAPHPVGKAFLRQSRQYLALTDQALAMSEDPREAKLPPITAARRR